MFYFSSRFFFLSKDQNDPGSLETTDLAVAFVRSRRFFFPVDTYHHHHHNHHHHHLALLAFARSPHRRGGKKKRLGKFAQKGCAILRAVYHSDPEYKPRFDSDSSIKQGVYSRSERCTVSVGYRMIIRFDKIPINDTALGGNVRTVGVSVFVYRRSLCFRPEEWHSLIDTYVRFRCLIQHRSTISLRWYMYIRRRHKQTTEGDGCHRGGGTKQNTIDSIYL